MISEATNEDCMIMMARYPDKFFDLAFPDPPYFSGPQKRKYYGQACSSIGVNRINYEPLEESWCPPNNEYYQELVRVSKQQIIFGINYFPDFLNVPVGRIIWDKVNDSSSFSDCEIASCSLIDTVRIFRFMWNGMLQGKSISQGNIMQGNKKLNEKRIHQTQKPIVLYKWLLEKFAQPGYKILDTHMGSQSSRIATYDMGFDYYGCDISPIAFINGCKRFELFKSQLKLL